MRGQMLPLFILGALALGMLGLVFSKRWVEPLGPGSDVARSTLVLREGRLCQAGRTNPFTGRMLEHYADGTLQFRASVASGVLDGLSEGWHPNGQLEVRESFRAGVSHGVRTKWRPGGAKLSEANIVAGKIEGTFRRWHENGVLAEEIRMRAGQPDGLSRAYSPGGGLTAEARMRAGRVLGQKFWPEGRAKVPAVLASDSAPAPAL